MYVKKEWKQYVKKQIMKEIGVSVEDEPEA